MSTFLYIKNMFRDRQVASVTPTSAAGVKRVCSKMNLQNRRVILEYGPATGVFTRFLLPRLSGDSRVILIERNDDFVRVLRKTFHDPRVRIYGDSAENVKDILAREGEPEADYILSGIPFSFFSDALRDRIVSRTHDVLRPGGKFLPYQTFFQKNEHLLDYLTRYFSEVRDEFFFYNVPPMRIYEAVK